MKLKFVLVSIVFMLCAACSPAADDPAIELPTLMVLPTEPPTAAFTAANTPLPTASCDIDGWRNEIDPIIVTFFDTAEVAMRTPRSDLASVVLELQRTWRSFERITSPSCSENAVNIHQAIRSGMQTATDGFNEFLGRNNYRSDVNFEIANDYFAEAINYDPDVTLLLDYRLHVTSTIWGGAEENATETHLAQATISLPLDLFGTAAPTFGIIWATPTPTEGS